MKGLIVLFFDNCKYRKRDESLDSNNYPESSMKCKKLSQYSSRVRDYNWDPYEMISPNHKNDYIIKKSNNFKSSPIKFNIKILNYKDNKSQHDKYGDSIMWSTQHFDNVQRISCSKKILLQRTQYDSKGHYCSYTNDNHPYHIFEQYKNAIASCRYMLSTYVKETSYG